MRARHLALPVLVLALTTTPMGVGIGVSPAAATTVATGTNGFAPAVPLYDAAGASTLGSEPSIHIDSKDNVYVSAPAGVPTGGCPFWDVHPDRTNAAGRIYDYRGTMDVDQGSVGGGDCDISSTPLAGPHDSVSVTSLSLANLTSNVTTDGGETWRQVANTVSQQIFGVDRQWQAADATLDRHYLSVHDLATSNIQVSVATDGGYQYIQNTPALSHTTNSKALSTGVVAIGLVSGSNHFGPTVVDPTTHKLYIPFLAPLEGTTGYNQHALYVAEGDPCATLPCTVGEPVGPITWTSHLAFTAPDTVNLSNDFPTLTMDRNGTLYAAFTGDVGLPASPSGSYDTNRIFVTHSQPGNAAVWSTPQAIDPGTANSNVFPWLVAGSTGRVGVAWYASTLAAPGPCPGAGEATNSPVSDNCLNLWHLAYAQSADADTASPTWDVTDASGLIHRGPICNQGLACADGTRTMLDFFDMDIDSQGRPNIAYVSDTRALNTADVQYTRQCSGTTLTGVALTAPCGPLGQPPVCTANGAYTDPAGDATNVLGAQTPAPSDDVFDILGGSFATTASHVVLSVKLKNLSNAPDGQIIEQHFKIAGKEYYVMATRPTGGGAITYVYGDMTTGTVPGRRKLGNTTGSFDDTTDVVTTAFPRTVTTPALLDGTLITGLAVTTRRDGNAVIPDVDTAAGTCPYAVGAVAEPVVPEVPVALLLPVVGVALFGFLHYRRRRALPIA
ncbi:MAG: hypothetical protein JJD92_11370 [Frankiaceae bacterium]|nr:hypothetical protein [Frankiaceae bacterium]